MKLAILVLAVALAGCAGMTQQTPQQALQSYCTVSVPEIAAFQSEASKLTPKAQAALAKAAPVNATLCSPASIAAASAADVATFTAQVLPAITVITIELAAKPEAPVTPTPIPGVQ